MEEVERHGKRCKNGYIAKKNDKTKCVKKGTKTRKHSPKTRKYTPPGRELDAYNKNGFAAEDKNVLTPKSKASTRKRSTGNPWIAHVKNYASTHNMSYRDALKSKECKNAYKK